jgi:hypothetical protein
MHAYELVSFLSYRSNRVFSSLMLEKRPDIFKSLWNFSIPLKDDTDASLLATLHDQGLLPEELRLNFVDKVRCAAVEDADASFLDDTALAAVLTDEEKDSILAEVEANVLPRIDHYVDRLRDEWPKDYPPEDHFDNLERSMKVFVDALSYRADYQTALRSTKSKISRAVALMNDDYEPSSSTSAPTASSTPSSTPLANLFRDIDE